MKKIIFMLSLLTLIFVLHISVQADFNANEAMLLNALGIADVASDDADTTVTRGEFSEYALRFMAIENFPEAKDYSFADVSEYTPEADAVYTLKSLNILAGAGDGNFYPDSPITKKQAAVVTARMLGYGAISKNIELDAAKLGISDMTDEPLTLGELVSLFFRALECECVTEGYSDTESTYEFKENYLSEIFGVYYGNGVLTQNSLTTLDGTGEALPEYTVIENHKLRNDGFNADEFLGMNVNYYYMSKKHSGNNADTLLCAYPSDVGTVIKINSKDIISSDGKTIKYDDSSNVRTLTVSADADVIYNGIACPDYEISMLCPQSGTITYIKNASGNDCVKIDEYINTIVSSVTGECIYLKNGNKIEFDEFDDGRLEICDADGNKADAVPAGAVISIYRSSGKDYLRAVYSTDILDDAVISEADDESITVNGVRYFVSSRYSGWHNVVRSMSGSTFKIYLDAYGEVAKISKASNGLAFGYVISAYQKPFSTLFLRVLVEDGEIESIECADKISIDGDRKDYTLETLIHKLSDKNSEGFAQLVTYKTNKKGQITSLNTALNRDTFSNSVADKEIEGFKISYKTSSDDYYKTSTKIFGTNCPVDDSTKVFFVSSDPEAQSSEYYWTGSISYLENDDRADSAVGYTTTAQFGNAEAMVVYGAQTGASIGSETRIAVVKKMSRVMNEDSEIRTRITFITGGKLVAYNLNDSLKPEDYGLSEGDLVRFAIDRNYEVSKLEMICNLKSDGSMALLYGENKDWTNTSNAGGAVYRIVSGSVYEYADGLICISRGDVNSINLEKPRF